MIESIVERIPLGFTPFLYFKYLIVGACIIEIYPLKSFAVSIQAILFIVFETVYHLVVGGRSDCFHLSDFVAVVVDFDILYCVVATCTCGREFYLSGAIGTPRGNKPIRVEVAIGSESTAIVEIPAIGSGLEIFDSIAAGLVVGLVGIDEILHTDIIPTDIILCLLLPLSKSSRYIFAAYTAIVE